VLSLSSDSCGDMVGRLLASLRSRIRIIVGAKLLYICRHDMRACACACVCVCVFVHVRVRVQQLSLQMVFYFFLSSSGLRVAQVLCDLEKGTWTTLPYCVESRYIRVSTAFPLLCMNPWMDLWLCLAFTYGCGFNHCNYSKTLNDHPFE